MTTTEAQAGEYIPTDFRGRVERAKEREHSDRVDAILRRRDLVELMGSKTGRRLLRHILVSGGLVPSRTMVKTIFNPNFGTMSNAEGLRAQAVQLLWSIVKLTVHEQVPLEHLQALMTETDK